MARPWPLCFALLAPLALSALPAGCGPGPEGRLPAPRPPSSAPARGEPATRSVCFPGRGDCDGQLANGCEEDLITSRANCGLCGKSCRGDCMGGVCAEDASRSPAPAANDPAPGASLRPLPVNGCPGSLGRTMGEEFASVPPLAWHTAEGALRAPRRAQNLPLANLLATQDLDGKPHLAP